MYRLVLIVLAVAVGAVVLHRLERAAGTQPCLSRGVAIGIAYVIISGIAWAGVAILLSHRRR